MLYFLGICIGRLVVVGAVVDLSINCQGSVTLSILGLDGAYADRTFCSSSPLVYVVYAWKMALLCVGCYLSYKTRNLDAAFAESKSLVVVMYE